MLNIYWCYDRYIYYGAYIVAESRNKARIIASKYFENDYIDTNARCFKKDVDEDEGKIFECTDMENVKKYHLKYTCDDCGFIRYCPFYRTTETNQNDYRIEETSVKV